MNDDRATPAEALEQAAHEIADDPAVVEDAVETAADAESESAASVESTVVEIPAVAPETEPTLEELEQNPLARFLLYTVSLPERAVRSTVGAAAGAARESAVLLVPSAFQSSKTYEILVRNSLNFLCETVGGVEGSEETKLDDDYLARKTVGDFVGLAGLATLHVSPVWMLAIVSDVAYGTKTYVKELAVELEKKGLIDDASTIHHIDDVLDAVQNASGEAASTFDAPPLSVDQLRESLNRTKAAISSADYRRVVPESELKQYWAEMREVAAKEDVGLLGVSGALTMHTLGKVATVSKSTLTGVQVVGGLFSRHVMGHYIESLETIRNRGFYETVRETSTPYVEALWQNFESDQSTWTEEVVTGRVFGKVAGAVTGWWRGRGRNAESPDVATPTGPPPPEGVPLPEGVPIPEGNPQVRPDEKTDA